MKFSDILFAAAMVARGVGVTTYPDAYIGSVGIVSATSTYTFAAQSLGTVHASRYITLIMETQGGTACNHSAVSIGGVSATKNVEVVSGTSTTMQSMWTALVPTGTTGDIVLTVDDDAGTPVNTGRFVCHWWAHSRGQPTATDLDSSVPMSQTITVGTDGLLIAGSWTSSLSEHTCTWSNVTEDYDLNVIGAGNIYSSGGRNTTPGTYTVAATWTGGSPQRMVMGIFGASV